MKFEKDEDIARWLEALAVSSSTFQWDRGNETKNRKHAVGKEEVEQLFLGPMVLGGRIVEPFNPESRWVLFGRTSAGRNLTLIFTIRDGLIRPISCRTMRKQEIKIYEKIAKR